MEPADLTITTVPDRFRKSGDAMATIDERAYSLDPLLEPADRQEDEGVAEAPFPPHFPKGEREPMRVAPSRAKKERR